MGTEFTPVFLFLIVGIGLAAGMIIGSGLLAPKKATDVKQMPYESGMDPIGDARQRFDVRYYLVAIVFLLFDVELLFLYPWAVAQWSAGPAAAAAGAPPCRLEYRWNSVAGFSWKSWDSSRSWPRPTPTHGGKGYSNGGRKQRSRGVPRATFRAKHSFACGQAGRYARGSRQYDPDVARSGYQLVPKVQPLADAFCNGLLWNRVDGGGCQPI